MLAVAIDDHARQSVALAPDHAAKFRIDLAADAVICRLCDSALKKIEIEVLSLPRKTACDDLRFRIINRTADQMIFTIFERNDVAIGRSPKNLQHLAGKDPIVSMQNSGTRLDDDSSHMRRATVQRSTLNVQRSTQPQRCRAGASPTVLCHVERSRDISHS